MKLLGMHIVFPRVLKNKTKTTAVAHNLFRFDLFFLEGWCLENKTFL